MLTTNNPRTSGTNPPGKPPDRLIVSGDGDFELETSAVVAIDSQGQIIRLVELAFSEAGQPRQILVLHMDDATAVAADLLAVVEDLKGWGP